MTETIPRGSYLSAAQTALGGGTAPGSSDQATALKYAQCVRANGAPGYPDPTGDSSNRSIHASSGSDLNPANPTYQACFHALHEQEGLSEEVQHRRPQPGSINIVGGLEINSDRGPDVPSRTGG